MKSVILIVLGLFATGQAISSTNRISSQCEQNIVNVVFDRLGRFDETFSVVGYSVIYENSGSGLAVVRTSDEVEPRDVLVSFARNNSQNECTVVFKEVLADGLTADLDNQLIELPMKPQMINSKYLTLEGTLTEVVTGEIDPFLIGDACLLQLKNTKGELIGLVTDLDLCDENMEKLKVGVALKASIHKKNQIKDKATLAELRSMFPAKKFYNVTFDSIKIQ
jgi:hypothetical protein